MAYNKQKLSKKQKRELKKKDKGIIDLMKIFQLYYTCSAVIRELSQSRKNTSSWLLESFRRQKVTDEDVSFIVKYTTVYLE